jgi:hypothetical protein
VRDLGGVEEADDTRPVLDRGPGWWQLVAGGVEPRGLAQFADAVVKDSGSRAHGGLLAVAECGRDLVAVGSGIEQGVDPGNRALPRDRLGSRPRPGCPGDLTSSRPLFLARRATAGDADAGRVVVRRITPALIALAGRTPGPFDPWFGDCLGAAPLATVGYPVWRESAKVAR